MRPCRLLALLPALALSCAAPQKPDPAPAVPEREVPSDGPYLAANLAQVVDLEELAMRGDGREIAYTSDRTGSLELWTIALDGQGGAGFPKERTHAKESVSGLVYAPDSSMLVFGMDHGGDERMDLFLLRRDALAPEQLLKTDTAEQAVRFSPDSKRLTFEADPERPFVWNAHVMDVATRTVLQLTREKVNVRAPCFSKDGRFVAATKTPDDQKGDLLVIDVATKSVSTIPAPRKGGIVFAEGFFPDGRLLARALNDAGFMQMAIVDVAQKKVSFVGPGDWDVELAKVAGNGTVLYSRNVRGESELGIAIGPELKRERVLYAGGTVTAADLDGDARGVALLTSATNRPPELVLFDTDTLRAKTLVPAEVGRVKVASLGRAERREFKSFDGRSIDAFVLKPPRAPKGSKTAAVVVVHGGPGGEARATFDPLWQALAEADIAVIAPNYRGSGGYGRAFEDLNNKDWGGGDLKDILAIVDALDQRGEIDRGRVGIMGGSYGGYLTLRAITHAPDAFRAAVDMYGMPDLEEDYRLTASRFATWYQTEMGDPAKDKALFYERSPIHFLDRVKVPLLVLQGANDTNVPRAEADAMVEALKRRGADVEYVVYPNEGHGFTHRENRTDAMTRTVDFFRRTLKP